MTSLVRPRCAFAAAISALISLALIPFLLFSPVVHGQKGKSQPGAPVVRRSPLSPPTLSFVVRGTLIGGDLTDPENNGDPENNVNYNATFNASEEPPTAHARRGRGRERQSDGQRRQQCRLRRGGGG